MTYLIQVARLIIFQIKIYIYNQPKITYHYQSKCGGRNKLDLTKYNTYSYMYNYRLNQYYLCKTSQISIIKSEKHAESFVTNRRNKLASKRSGQLN